MKPQLLLLSALIIFSFANKAAAQTEVKINYEANVQGLVIESDGTIEAEGSATTWEDLRVPLVNGENRSATGLSVIGSTGLKVYFSSVNDEVHFVAQIPHNYKEGTVIYPHLHWIGSAGGNDATERPKFELEYSWVNLNETISSTTIYAETEVAPSGLGTIAANTHYISKFDGDAGTGGLQGISGTGKTISSMLVCTLTRVAADPSTEYGGDVGLIEFDFHYQVNTMGSRDEYTK